jgi:hypothetical protein
VGVVRLLTVLTRGALDNKGCRWNSCSHHHHHNHSHHSCRRDHCSSLQVSVASLRIIVGLLAYKYIQPAGRHMQRPACHVRCIFAQNQFYSHGFISSLPFSPARNRAILGSQSALTATDLPVCLVASESYPPPNRPCNLLKHDRIGGRGGEPPLGDYSWHFDHSYNDFA